MSLPAFHSTRAVAVAELQEIVDALFAAFAPDLVKTPHPQINSARFLKEAKFEALGASQHPCYKATYRGRTYFMKELPKEKVSEELMGRDLAHTMGLKKNVGHAQAIESEGKHAIVTQWHNEPTMFGVMLQSAKNSPGAGSGSKAVADALDKVPATTKTRLLLHEYLMGDAERHTGDYFVDGDKGKLLAHDFEFGTTTKVPKSALLQHGFGGMIGMASQHAAYPIPKSILNDVISHQNDIYALATKHHLSGDQVNAIGVKMQTLKKLAAMDHPTVKDLEDLSGGVEQKIGKPHSDPPEKPGIVPKPPKAEPLALAAPPKDQEHLKHDFLTEPVTSTALKKEAKVLHDLTDQNGQQEYNQTTIEHAAQAVADRLKDNPAWQKSYTAIANKYGYGHGYTVTPEKAARAMIESWNGNSNQNTLSVAMQVAAEREFELPGVWTGQPGRKAAEDFCAEHGEAMQAALRAMHEHTQERLKAAGLEYVTVVRGAYNTGYGSKKFVADGVPRVQKLRPAALSSFTADPKYAITFSKKGSEGLICGGRVHRSRILSFGFTGPGTKYEAEYVVLGRGDEPCLCYGYNTSKYYNAHKKPTGVNFWSLLAQASTAKSTP